MKTEVKEINMKKEYILPDIVCIRLDHEISIHLQSEPPTGPLELSKAPEYFKNDPFQKT